MKKIYIFFILVVSVRVNALEFNDSIKNRVDSIRDYPRFKFAKPYIGWEVWGPSNYLALTYQQQFMQLSKNSFLDLQILINNRNILLQKYSYLGTYVDVHKIHKFAIYLIEQNKISKCLNGGIGLGYLHYQEILLVSRENWTKNKQDDLVILKGIFSVNVCRNFLVNLNVNYIFFDKHWDLPYDFFIIPINFSYSFLFGFNKKNEENINNVKFENNQLFINLTKLQLGYERFLLNRNDYNVSISFASSFIPYKRYGEFSYKYGWFTLADAMVNFNYLLTKKTYSFVGIGGTFNYITYYVLNDKYDMHTYGLHSQIGLGFKLGKHLGFKLFYTPYITGDFNINIEGMNRFYFIREYKLNLSLFYSFGK